MRLALPLALALAALGACQPRARPPEPPPNEELDPAPYGAPATPAAAAAALEAWRPQWWLEKPARTASSTTVAAFATERDLLTARKRAVAAANKQLADLARQSPPTTADATPTTTAPKAVSIRLADGSYRAFVLLSSSSTSTPPGDLP